MSSCRVIDLQPAKGGLVSRAAALRTQGAASKYALSGWSGIRADDGMVVFVLPAEAIITDAAGARCLLWAPDGIESAARRERLEHCKRAFGHGQADALIALEHGTQVDPASVLGVRVERQQREYWALWGRPAHMLAPRNCAVAEHALCA